MMQATDIKNRRGSLASAVLACICALVLALGTMLPTGTAALADDEEGSTTTATGSATLTLSETTSGDTYSAWKLFDGSFSTDDEGNTVMGSAVVNGAYEEAIVKALYDLNSSTEGYSIAGYTVTASDDGIYTVSKDESVTDTARANALMDAIDALSEDDTDAAGSTNRSFANALADYLSGSSATATETATSDSVTFSSLDEGYYLVTSEDADGDSSETTGLLLMVVESGTNSATIKTSTPTVEKETVADDETGAYLTFNSDGTASVSYTVTGTVASNIADFDAYYYSFVDDLPDGITITSSTSKISSWSVTVYAGSEDTAGTDVTSCFTMTAIDGDDDDTEVGDEVTWHTDDLLSLTTTSEDGSTTSVTVDASSQIVLSYTITICESEVAALFGSSSTATSLDNTASIIFSNDPSAEGNGTTDDDNDGVPDDEDKDGEWPDDNDDGETPSTGGDGDEGDGGNNGTFDVYTLTIYKIIADSTTALTGADFTVTTSDGSTVYESTAESESGVSTFTFGGLTEGVVYTITEVETPDGYKSIDPISFTISASESEDGTVTVTVNETSDPSGAGSASLSDNAVTYTIENTAGASLPVTGQQGIMLGLLIGAAIIAVSCAAIARNRRKDAKQAA